MLKNKKILIVVLVAVVAIVATIFTFFQRNLGGTSGGAVAYVDTISNIMVEMIVTLVWLNPNRV